MKKTLIALAALAATASFAQSSVTLFGVADTAVTYTKTGAAKKTAMTTSGLNSSRLGFRGEEDLGGGLKAGFWMEAGVNTDSGAGSATNSNNQATGAGVTQGTAAGTGGTTYGNPSINGGSQGLTFNRRMTVSLMGGFGEVRLGRDFTPLFWNHTVYDPFGTNGAGASQANAAANPATLLVGVRASNSIGYLSPSFNGFKVQLQTFMGENASNDTTNGKNSGSGNGLRATYDNGPLSVALANAKYDTALNVKHEGTNFGASYDLGVAKVMGVYSEDQDSTSGVKADKVKGTLIGATAPLGAGVAKIAFSNGKQGSTVDTDKTAIGYVYSLSKRTSLYTAYAQTKPKTGDKTTAFDLGVSHSF
ncbi:MAG: porin [Limnohabitans sp.]|nr:MAG: porin [Limnohabitans sp.]